MTNKLDIIAATVQQLLAQTTDVLRQNGVQVTIIQDEMLESLERDTRLAMVQLKRGRNESLPINRLPPELLSMVFGHLRRPPSPRRKLTYLVPFIGFASYKPLITAMLVCQKWHLNVSHAGFLWTDIDFAQKRPFASLLVTRSLGAPIHLNGHLTSKDNTLETTIKDNGARIRELDLWAQGPLSSLQSILSADMPQVRTLCLSREYARADPTGAATVLQLNSAQASFPSLRAILLTGVLFVPTHVLPRLTHLHLARMAQVDASTILDLLRNTPALEVLEIKSRDVLAPPNSATISSRPVSLPRLQSAHISHSTSAVAHCLMAALDVPSLAFLDLTVHVNGGTLLSVPPLPRALATHPMRRLAFDVGSDSDFNPSFHAALHGSGASLAIGLHAHNVLHTGTEWAQWMLTDLPTTLPLSGIEEFHIRAREWHAPEDVLPHLAVYMPAVSTLLIKHETRDDDYDYDDGDDTDGHMELARAVARILTSDGPVLFPRLMHLELIVGSIPLAFCELLARALGHRDVGGRRLRRLRIRVDEEHYDSFGWREMGAGRGSEYRKTGIFDHVDVCKIPDGSSDGAGDEPNDGDTQRLGWGKWRDCVQQARHEYWEE